jgi:hypothetical protein
MDIMQYRRHLLTHSLSQWYSFLNKTEIAVKMVLENHKIMQVTEEAACISNNFIMDIHSSTDYAYIKSYLSLFKRL